MKMFVVFFSLQKAIVYKDCKLVRKDPPMTTVLSLPPSLY